MKSEKLLASTAASRTRPSTTTTTTTRPQTTTSSRTTATSTTSNRQPNPPPSSQKVSELETEVTQLKLAIENLEKERDFYFDKLREIEVLVQNIQANQDHDVVKDLIPAIEQILYNTEVSFFFNFFLLISFH